MPVYLSLAPLFMISVLTAPAVGTVDHAFCERAGVSKVKGKHVTADLKLMIVNQDTPTRTQLQTHKYSQLP